MAIPESQLETWSHQGSVSQSSATYQTVKSALEASTGLYADKVFKVFLQGSYGNDTNIYAESDVDTVIRLDSIFRSDISGLPPDQQAAYRKTYSSASYTFVEFKQGVETRLSTAFGSDYVAVGNKAIKIKPNQSRRNADVVPCYQYRRYTRFISDNDNAYVPGIIFPSSSSGEIINFPTVHSENCTTKHQATSSWFKPVVRIFKNMRSRMVSDGLIAKDTAPSYYIEGLLYNVPKANFGVLYKDTFCNCVNWLIETDRSQLNCAHGQYRLLGDSNVQWPTEKCTQYLDALVQLWNEW